MEKKEFTVLDGLRLQADDLFKWKQRLNTATYDKVINHFIDINLTNEYKSGYDVPRGNDITTFITNINY